MTTPNLSITEVAAAQAQKYVTVNEALRVLDTALNLTVIRADNTGPPGAPTEGDKYIPFAPATGAWSGQENKVAVYINSEWLFFTPAEGWRAYDQTRNQLILFNGTSWADFVPVFGNGSAGAPSFAFGSDPDTGMYRNAANELAFATGGSERFKLSNSQASSSMGNWLLNHAGTDSLLILNKNVAGDDASLTFQQGFSHQASMGIQGDNNFGIKVGAGFTTALSIDNATGDVTFPAQTSVRTLLPFGGRWTLNSTDNRWVGPGVYGLHEIHATNSGTGANPNVDWDAKGNHYLSSGTVLHKLRLTWNINNAEVTDVFWKLYFQHTTFDGNTNTIGEVTRVEVNGGTFTPAGVAAGLNVSDLISSDYTCPGEGYLLLYCKPNGVMTAARYLQATGMIDLTYQGF